jgi:hypothetical protein
VLGATIGTLSVVNATGTPTFALDVTDGNTVAIDGADLERGATALDFETKPTLNVTVSVSGVTPAIDPRNFAISVTDTADGGGAGMPIGLLLTLTKAA